MIKKFTDTTKRILAIIPARGGSKSLPKKNILPINGKPLIFYSIQAAIQSEYVSRTVVSTDCQEIANISRLYGAEVLKRPPELATDTARSEPVVTDILNKEILKKREYDIVILLQPTSPLRSASDIDGAIASMLDNNALSIISVFDFGYQPHKCFIKNKEGFLKALVTEVSPFLPRQKLSRTYLPNGAIYAVKAQEFLRNNSFIIDPCLPYVMCKDKSIDIDTLSDLQSAERFLRKDHDLVS